MKKYLIRLNRPVTVDDSYHGTPIKQTIYGFLGPYDENNSAENAYHKECFGLYVSYLAAMHCWSENGGAEFSVCNKVWIDQEGDAYPYEWRDKICQRDRETLGLDYTLYVVDLDGIDEAYLHCGTDGSIILSSVLLEELVKLAGGEDAEQVDVRNVVLFNHPVWLPKHILWKGETGYCHIYGLALEDGIGQWQLKGINQYLGYLAMIEEVVLNGVTPSGFTTDIEGDDYRWYNRGETYLVNSPSITAECDLCRNKHNYKIRGIIEDVLQEDLIDGVKSELIISKALYEGLLYSFQD